MFHLPAGAPAGSTVRHTFSTFGHVADIFFISQDWAAGCIPYVSRDTYIVLKWSVLLLCQQQYYCKSCGLWLYLIHSLIPSTYHSASLTHDRQLKMYPELYKNESSIFPEGQLLQAKAVYSYRWIIFFYIISV